MRSARLIFASETALRREFPWNAWRNDDTLLIQLFVTESAALLERVGRILSQHFDRAVVVGVTAEAAIADTTTREDAITVSILQFEHSRVHADFFSLQPDGFQLPDGTNRTWDDTTRALILLTSARSGDIEVFLTQLPADIPVVGGMASQSKDGQVAVYAAGAIRSDHAVLIGLCGAGLQVHTNYHFGWEPLGLPHVMTEANGKILQAVDYVPAKTFYEKMLGPFDERAGLSFPLLIKQEGYWLARTPLQVLQDGSICYAGGLQEGELVHIGFGNREKIVHQAEHTCACNHAEVALIYSCVGRMAFLGAWKDKTLTSFSHLPNSGFYTLGEVIRPGSGKPVALFNETLVYLCLSEREQAIEEDIWQDAGTEEVNSQHMPLPVVLTDRLIHLLAVSKQVLDSQQALMAARGAMVFQLVPTPAGFRTVYVTEGIKGIGYSPESWIKERKDLFERFRPDDPQQLDKALQAQTGTFRISGHIRGTEDQLIRVRLYLLHQPDNQLWVLAENITDEVQLGRIFTMFSRGPVVLFEWSGEAGWPIRYVSPNVTQVLNLPYEALSRGERTFASFIHLDDLDRVSKEVADYLSRRAEDFIQLYRLLDQSGTVRWVRDYTHVEYGITDRETRIFGFVIDVTQEQESRLALEKEKAQAAWAALHDSLTGLYNRRFLEERLAQRLAALKRGEQAWYLLIFLDLDNFKHINDTAGHSVGDEILQIVAERLKKKLHSHDILARFGGDEFVLLIGPIHGDEERAFALAHKISNKLLASVAQPLTVEGNTYYLSASMGIVLFNQALDDVETLIRYADISLYQAKRAGRNQYAFYSKALQQREERESRLFQALHSALENWESCEREFKLFFQPKVCVYAEGNSRLIGAEALLRWHSKMLGEGVSPAEFIPLAEHHGLINMLGKWVIDHALAQMAQWQEQLPSGFLMNINISPLQLHDKDFVAYVQDRLIQYHVKPERIRLEVTETALMEDAQRVIEILKQLRQLGVTLSIDDFGTGYASLTYLKQLPVQELKIDQNFVRGVTQDNDDQVLVKTMIDLARNFGMEPIAEGVEDESALLMLKQLGCHDFQGYCFSPPLSPQAFLEWAQAQHLLDA